MKKILLLFLFLFTLSGLFAYEIVVPQKNEETYMVMKGDESLEIDDYYYYKSIFSSSVLVERFSEHITTLKGEGVTVLVLQNCSESELESVLFSLSFSVEKPVILSVSSELSFENIKELGASYLYTADNLTSSTRAMLRSSGIGFEEISSGSILNVKDGAVSLISGDKNPHKGGFYIKCPDCGAMIYVP
ncbi:MAG TPA: hypothetical protein IAB12_05230 [Candidatus Ornithospirochaeta avicola]|uniref:Uncharacterized protein n=1 Tax=Candidatus Ornithospirochaeta avicola TaxID=2840896 RepID=A0A9D1PUT9_9SPIO|nr:hypothetical protein [Candidatus Ornithospirochaeta avicola]